MPTRSIWQKFFLSICLSFLELTFRDDIHWIIDWDYLHNSRDIYNIAGIFSVVPKISCLLPLGWNATTCPLIQYSRPFSLHCTQRKESRNKAYSKAVQNCIGGVLIPFFLYKFYLANLTLLWNLPPILSLPSELKKSWINALLREKIIKKISKVSTFYLIKRISIFFINKLYLIKI